MSMRGWWFPGQVAGSKVKAHKTSGGRKMPVRHTIPLGIVIFLVLINLACIHAGKRQEVSPSEALFKQALCGVIK